VRDRELNPLRGQINRADRSPDLRRGAQVEVLSGMLVALRGNVLDVDRDQAVVQFSTKTLVRILSLPVGMLRVAEEPPAAPAVPAASAALAAVSAGVSAVPAAPATSDNEEAEEAEVETRRPQGMRFKQTNFFPGQRRRKRRDKHRKAPRRPQKPERFRPTPAQKVARAVQLGFKW
jgi:hypothetical protein